MDGKTLPRIGAIVFVAIAITISVIDLHKKPASEEAATPLAPVVAIDPLRGELSRCQSIGQAGASDTGCLQAWAKNRRRFLVSSERPAEVSPAEAADAPEANAMPVMMANHSDPAISSLDAGAH